MNRLRFINQVVRLSNRNIKLLHSVYWNPVQLFAKKLRVISIALLLLISFGADLRAQITSAGSGDWNNPSTWSTFSIPTSTDNVIIAAGHTVNVNISPAECNNITINSGTLNFTLGAANLRVYGNWTNTGTLIAGTGRVLFFGPGSATISGSGASAFYNLTINKGTDISSVVEANGAGAISNTENIAITNGLFKMTTGTFQFKAPSPTIPSSGGIWINGATLNSANSIFYLNDGLIKVSSGTANFGFASGNDLTTRTGGLLQIDGGNVNVAGSLINTAGTTNITGGTITLATIGNASAQGSFQMSLTTDLSISGNPTIIFQNASSNGSPLDINILSGAGTKTITGGTFQIGNASTPAGRTFFINSPIPFYNFTINNTNNPSVRLVSNHLTINNTLTLNGGNIDALTNGKKVIVASSLPAAIVRSAGHVIGDLQRAIATGSLTYNYPIGTTTSYTPVTIQFNNVTTGGNLTGFAKNGDHPSLNTSSLNEAASVNNYWTFTNSTVSPVAFSSYAATFNYPSTVPSDIDAGANPTNFRVGNYNGATWSYPTVSGTPTSTSTSITGVLSFGEFAIAECSAQIFTVTGGGNFCTGGTGVPVGLNNSENGFSYQLYVGASPTGSPVLGTGSNIDFGNQTTAGTYTVIATNTTTGCTAAMNGTVVVTAYAPPSANFTVTGAGTFCAGQGIVISLSGSENGVKYELYKDNDPKGYFSHPSITGTGGAIDFSPIFLTPGIYTIAVDGTINLPPPSIQPSCITRMLNTVTVTVLYTPSKPVISFSGNLAFCSGGSVLLIASSTDLNPIYQTNSPGVSFQWNKNGTAISGATNTQYTATTSGVYTVTFTIPNGCSSTSLPQTVTENPLPTVTCPGNSSVCINAAAFALTDGSPLGGTYSGPGVSGGNFDPATAGPGTHTITYTYTDLATNCTNSCTFTITVNSLPTATITGTTTVCQNATSPNITFTGANGTAPYTFTYTINNGPNQTVTTSGLLNSVTVPVPTTTAGPFVYALVSVQDASSTACSQSQTGSATVNINPLPTATIIGTTTVCQNATQPNITFTGADGTAPYNFTYTINSGSNQTITTTTGNSVTIAVPTGIAGPFVYTLVSVADANSCSQLQTGSQTVTVNPLPTATIIGATTVCQNASQPNITFTGANGTAPYTFTYTINSGLNQTVTSVGNTATVAVPTGTPGSFIYTLVSVQDASSTLCSQLQTGSQTITINPTPVVTATPSSQTICSGGTTSIDLSSNVSGSTISWTAALFSGTATGFSNGSGPTIAQTLTNATASPAIVRYTISVIANGCTGSLITADVTVNPLPAPAITGSASVCAGSTGNIYSTQGGMNNYVWSVSSGGTITGGTGTNSITVTWNVAGPQVVQVNYVDANNCTAASATVYDVTVNSIPTLTITDPAAVCTPSAVNLTLPGVTNNSSLTLSYWTDAAATTVLSSPTAVSISGTYYIKGTSASNCSIIKPVNVTVNTSPTLTITNPAAVCSPGTVDLSLPLVTNNSGLTLSYWTDAAATTAFGNYTTAGAGTYYIKGTDANGCYDIKPVTVTINATPTVTTSNIASVCTGSSTNITLTATTASTFSWTIGTITGTVNGASADFGNTINQVLTSSGNGGTVVYNVTPVSTTGNCTGTTYSITVSVNTLPVVTTQPEIINEVCAGVNANAVFTAIASGSPTPAVQWQVSTNGGTTWTNLTNGGNVSGATSTQLTLTNITTGYDGYKYQAIFTNSCGSVTSTISTLSISGTIKIKTAINQSSCGPGGYYTFSIELQGDQVASGRLEWWDGTSWQIVPGSVQVLGNGTPTYSYAILYSDYPVGTRFRINLTSNKCSLSYDSPDIPFTPTLNVTAPNSCIGGGNVTFTQTGGSGGVWSVNGGGTINSSGVFTPNAAGCWVAKYAISGGCEDTENFVVFPASPSLATPSNTCNATLANITAVATVSGFTPEYAVQAPGGTLSSYGDITTANALLNKTAGCWTIKARYKLTAACGSTAANSISAICPEATVNAVVFPAAPVLTAPVNTCASSFTLPSVPSITGFTTEYSIDGGIFTSSPASITTSLCHTIKARYTLTSACGSTASGTSGGSSCESNIVNVVIFPDAPSAPVVTAGCGLFTVTAPPSVAGFDIQYSYDDGVTWGTNTPPTADNCTGYKIKTRYILSADCGTTPAGSFSSSPTCKESLYTLRIIDLSDPVITCNTTSIPSVCTNSVNTYIHSGTTWDVSATDNCSLASVTAMLSGATNAGPYSTLNGITFNAGNTLVTWTATDACGNASSCLFTVTVNSLPTITTAAAAASVCNSTSAQTTPLTYSAVTNAPTTYSITWDPAAITAGLINVTDALLPASPIIISVPANTAAGTYTGTITVKNANGCVSTGTTFTITINPKPGPIIISHN